MEKTRQFSIHNKFGVELEFLSPFPESDLIAILKRKTGIEIKASTRLNKNYSNWQRKPDASITYEEHEKIALRVSTLYAHELVSPKLTSIEEVRKMVLALRDTNNGMPIALVNSSCGLHISIDGEGCSEEQITSIYYTYKCIEPSINMLVPSSRVDNKFCNNVQGLKFKDYKGGTSTHDTKYFSINIKEIDYRVEYRKLYMSLDVDYVINAIYLLQEIHEYGKTNIVSFENNLNFEDIIKVRNLQEFIEHQKELIKLKNNNVLTNIEEIRNLKPKYIPVNL